MKRTAAMLPAAPVAAAPDAVPLGAPLVVLRQTLSAVPATGAVRSGGTEWQDAPEVSSAFASRLFQAMTCEDLQ